MAKPTLLPPTLQRLAMAAGKENTKYAVSGVHLQVNPDGSFIAEATNTKILARVTGRAPFDVDNDFPAIPTLDAAANGHSEAIVPAAAWAKAFAKPSRKSARNRVLEQTAVVVGEKVTTFAHTDLAQVHSTAPTNEEGRFPPAADIIPKQPPAFVIKVDPIMLATILDIAAAFTDDERTDVTIEFQAGKDGKPSASHPIIIRRKNEHDEFTGLVMPLS